MSERPVKPLDSQLAVTEKYLVEVLIFKSLLRADFGSKRQEPQKYKIVMVMI